MTNSYPFSRSSEEFKDTRILVTGGTKGVGTRQPDFTHCAKKLQRARTSASPERIATTQDRLVRDTKPPVHDGTQLLVSHSPSARV